jgi:hypothetical protein
MQGLPVKVLHQAVGLWVVGSGLHMPDAQDVAEAIPEGRGEQVPPVGGDYCWHAIPRNSTLRKDAQDFAEMSDKGRTSNPLVFLSMTVSI